MVPLMTEPEVKADEGEASAGDEAQPESISQDQIACVEALLFASDGPLSPSRIVQAAGLSGRRGVTQAIGTLNERYDRDGSAYRIEAIAGGYQMRTRPEYHDVLRHLFKAKSETRLSQAALETLAIVAYRQPILRADVEAIRGVASGEVLRGLMEKQLVKIVGRAEVIGRPMLYGTTRRFLEIFGLKRIEDLPRMEELRRPSETKAAEQGAEEPDAEQEVSDSQPDPPNDASPETDKKAAPVGREPPEHAPSPES